MHRRHESTSSSCRSTTRIAPSSGQRRAAADHARRRANEHRFSMECGKPSAHFYGHTHGYSRGESRDAEPSVVNVASAGGNIDYWGEYADRRRAGGEREPGRVGLRPRRRHAGEPLLRSECVATAAVTSPCRVTTSCATTSACAASTRCRRRRARRCRAAACSGSATPSLRVLLGPGWDEHGATHWQIASAATTSRSRRGDLSGRIFGAYLSGSVSSAVLHRTRNPVFIIPLPSEKPAPTGMKSDGVIFTCQRSGAGGGVLSGMGPI